MAIDGECETYCPHGGQCRLGPIHGVKHRSAISDDDPSACEWTDEESISRAEANMLLIDRGGAEGVRIIAEENLLRMLIGFFGPSGE